MVANARVTLQSAEAIYVSAAATTNARLTKAWTSVAYVDAAATTMARVTKSWTNVAWAMSSATTMARVTKSWVIVAWVEDSGIAESASHTLTLTDVASAAGSTLSGIASSTITFTDTVFRTEKPGSLLQFTQLATATPGTVLNKSVTDTLTLTDDAIGNWVRYFSKSDVLVLTESAEWKKVLPTETASNALSLSDAADQSRPADHILSLVQVASAVVVVLGGAVDNTLSLSDSVDVDLISLVSASSTLALVSTATVDTVADLNPSDALTLTDSAVCAKAQNYCLLQVAADAVILPNPELQDAENLNNQVQIDTAIDGTLYTYVQKPGTRRITYTFRMTRAQSLELQDFLELYNADWMRFTNWKGEVWRVKLDQNPVVFSANKRDNQIDVHLTFDGTKLSG